ncbi:CBL-interacting serine/threonine-protein kinase 1-like isoform X1 [Wolffia australiana]
MVSSAWWKGERGMQEATASLEEARARRGGRWKYELGRTLGEGNFGKVKFARHVDSGRGFAVKILDKKRVIDLKIDDQIRREIGTLKLLKHPNVVRLHEVSASKTKIYIVLEYVTGGELFERIASGGRLSEREARKIFQQIVDAVSYCHDKGIYHRDLKPENVLLDAKGNVKISDFGLSALPQHLGRDGLLHTTCGSPNYVAPEVLANRGYDGAAADIWSCGVILYVILTGHLPFDDINLGVLYQKIFKGETYIPKWLSPGARRLIQRILDPNPKSRITVEGIKSDDWFKQGYSPVLDNDDDDDDLNLDHEEFSIKEFEKVKLTSYHENVSNFINAFELIGMSSYLDLSGFFENEDVSDRRIRFTSALSPKELLDGAQRIVEGMGFHVQKKHSKLKIGLPSHGSASPVCFSAEMEIIEVSPVLHVVELRKYSGHLSLYQQLCRKLSNDLGDHQSCQFLMAAEISSAPPSALDFGSLDAKCPAPAL